MTAPTPARHVLHVRVEDSERPEELSLSVSCPFEPTDLARACVLWWECQNAPAGARADLLDRGLPLWCAEAPAPFDRHDLVRFDCDYVVAHPSRGCYLVWHDDLWHAARYLHLSAGTYLIDFTDNDYGVDGGGLTFHLAETAVTAHAPTASQTSHVTGHGGGRR